MVLFVGFVLFLLGRAQLFLFFFLDGFFFFSPKWILWCEKVGMACADKADTKRPDQLSFAPSMARRPSSPLSPVSVYNTVSLLIFR